MKPFSDPTQIEWGNDKNEEDEEPQAPPPTTAPPIAPTVQTFKCTALYSYTVSILSAHQFRFDLTIFLSISILGPE